MERFQNTLKYKITKKNGKTIEIHLIQKSSPEYVAEGFHSLVTNCPNGSALMIARPVRICS